MAPIPRRREASSRPDRTPKSSRSQRATLPAPSVAEVARAYVAFRRLSMGDATRHTVRVLHSSQMTVAQVAALLTMREHGTRSISELATAIGLSVPATSQMVERLVARRLVRRISDVTDRRRKSIALTRSATTFLAKMDEASQLAATLLVRELPPPLLSQLVDVFRAVSARLEERRP